MKWSLRRRKCDIFAFNLIISFATVKHWLITLNSASIFRRKVHSAWLTFMTTVSSAIMLSTVFTFTLHCVSIEVLMWCSLFLMKSLRICESYLSCSLTLCNHLSNDLFFDSNNRLHSALLLSERKMNLMSHWCYLIVSMMSAQIVFDQ
jgi:hypothetical protein